MTDSQVSSYSQTEAFQQCIDIAIITYLHHLKSLGYIFEKKTYEPFEVHYEYHAIHPDFFLNKEEREKDENWDYDPSSPFNDYPKGAWLNITDYVQKDAILNLFEWVDYEPEDN